MRKITLFILLFLATAVRAVTVEVSALHTEQMENPLGLDTATPRFSWQMRSDGTGVMQTAYRVLVASSAELLAEGKADLWDSGRVESDQSLWIAYGGTKLKSNQRAFWRVKCYTNQGETPWSETARFGKVVSRWKKTLRHLEWEVEIPVNTQASVHLPDGKVETVGSGKHRFSAEIPATDKRITADEFLYEDAGFPQCHGATIVELANGDLVAAFFGGTREKNPDCNIWVCRKPHGSDAWTKPYKAADGIYTRLTAAAFSEEDLRKFAARDSILDELLKERPGATREERFGLFREAMLRMGGAKAAAPAVPMGDGKHYPWWMAPAKNSSKPLVDETWRKPCYNPVLFQIPGGDLVLYYKIGYGVSDWTGWQVRSKNGGKTWGKPEALPEGFLGAIKNKPVYVNGRIIAPSSTENDGWKFHFEISDDKGKSWKYVGPIEAEYSLPTANRKANVRNNSQAEDLEAGEALKGEGMRPILCIQPSILTLKDGRLMAIGRTRNAQLAVTYSSDCGESWSKVTLCDLPNNNSGTDAVTLADGRQVVIYNDFATLPGTPKGVRTPLSIAVSEDDGKTWKREIVLEESPISQYSYPSIIQGKDGKLHCIYTWRRKRIAYKKIEL